MTVQDGTNFLVNDIVMLKSEQSIDGSYKKGELMKIESKNGNDITIQEQSQFSNLTSESAKLMRYDQIVRNVIIDGFTIVGTNQSGNEMGFYLFSIENLKIINNIVRDTGLAGIDVEACYIADVSNNYITGVKQSGNGYATHTGEGSKYVNIHHNTIIDNDEGFDCGAANAYGYPTLFKFNNNYVINSVANSMDSHRMCFNYEINDNTFINVGAWGIQLDGGRGSAERNLITTSSSYCIHIPERVDFGETESYQQHVFVKDNKCINFDNTGIELNKNRTNVQIISNT